MNIRDNTTFGFSFKNNGFRDFIALRSHENNINIRFLEYPEGSLVGLALVISDRPSVLEVDHPSASVGPEHRNICRTPTPTHHPEFAWTCGRARSHAAGNLPGGLQVVPTRPRPPGRACISGWPSDDL